MKKRLLILGTYLLIYSGFAFSFSELQVGFDRDQNREPFVDIRTKLQYRPGYLIKVSEGYYFALSPDGLGVAEYHLSGAGSVTGWPLTRWRHELQNDPEVSALYDMSEAQEGDLWHTYAHHRQLNINSLGCLANRPLRYGDTNSDGHKELVLLPGLDNQQLDFVIFSPSAEKIQFSARIAQQDVITPVKQARYQYLSDALGHLGARPARRIYAKLFVGDFDENGSPDILVWRKGFQSLTGDAETEGFQLHQELYRHYSQNEAGGEYLRRDTDLSTIKAWLAAEQLTWQKGYPSESECPGEEGTLIPEMHDPLLNDPDVLQ